MEVAGVLHFILDKAVRSEFVPMIADILVKGDVYKTQLRKLQGPISGRLTRLEAAKTVDASYLSSEPVFWAMAKLANYQLQGPRDPPQKLPLAEIVQVAAQAIRRDNDETRDLLVGANALVLVDDLAALSCMLNMLESHPGFVKVETSDAYDSALSTHGPFLRSYRGGHYANSQQHWNDVFQSRPFVDSQLANASKLLKDFFAIKVHKWFQNDLLQQLRNARALRSQLDDFWEEMSEKRIEYLSEENGLSRDDIEILPDVTIMQQGYEDLSALYKIQQNIDVEEQALASQSKKEHNVPIGSYAPFPTPPTSSRDRTREAALSKKRARAAERDERAEQARLALGAAPTPLITEPPPAEPITVEQKHLRVIAWFWPYDSHVFGKSSRKTWANCMSALLAAGLRLSNIQGNHHTFTGDSGSFAYNAPHAGRSAKMEFSELINLGVACTRSLGWTWATFDPQAVVPAPAVG